MAEVGLGDEERVFSERRNLLRRLSILPRREDVQIYVRLRCGGTSFRLVCVLTDILSGRALATLWEPGQGKDKVVTSLENYRLKGEPLQLDHGSDYVTSIPQFTRNIVGVGVFLANVLEQKSRTVLSKRAVDEFCAYCVERIELRGIAPRDGSDLNQSVALKF